MRKLVISLLMIFIVASLFAAEYRVSESKETKISKIKEEGYEIIVQSQIPKDRKDQFFIGNNKRP